MQTIDRYNTTIRMVLSKIEHSFYNLSIRVL